MFEAGHLIRLSQANARMFDKIGEHFFLVLSGIYPVDIFSCEFENFPTESYSMPFRRCLGGDRCFVYANAPVARQCIEAEGIPDHHHQQRRTAA
jgi:hypothetical protein